MNTVKIIGGILLLGVVGCAGPAASTKAPATAPATQPVATTADSAKNDMHVDVMLTSMTPSVTAGEISQQCLKMRFAQSDVFGNPMSYALVAREDHFYGFVKSTTAAGYEIDTDCNWLSEQKTEVTVRTNLPVDQREYVIAHFRAALDPYPPATQPAQ